ncbi:MAG TPA: DUF3999 family protein [Methylomirabilota bacterium]|nr:DUF3999 family protein [Methylomirabilota bacterium]
MLAAIQGHALAVTLVLAGVAAVAAESARDAAGTWAFRKPISVPALTAPAFVELRPDADVVRQSAPTLADLRIRDGNGADVAYAFRRRERAAVAATRDTPMQQLVTTGDGEVRFVVDTGDGKRHRRVRLSIREQARNFRVPVRVETADDGKRWRIVREAGFIYRVEGETKTAETSVGYPGSTARWLRVTVGPEKGRALPLAGAAVVLDDAGTREEERVPAALVLRDAESMRRTTRLVLDLRARRPTDRLELDVAERTFRRVVLLEAGDDRKTWRWVGSAPISSVDVAGIRERLTSVRFPETTARYLRLTIQNVDDPPLTVNGARVFAVKRALVFEAMPGRSYVLDYGNPRAVAPREDARAAVASVDRIALTTATVGAVRAVPAPPVTRSMPAHTLAAWSTTAMAALALASLGWRMVRARKDGAA